MCCRPLSKWQWRPLLWFNWFLAAGALGADTVTGIIYALKQLVEDVDTFRWFATCYQCGKGSSTG